MHASNYWQSLRAACQIAHTAYKRRPKVRSLRVSASVASVPGYLSLLTAMSMICRAATCTNTRLEFHHANHLEVCSYLGGVSNAFFSNERNVTHVRLHACRATGRRASLAERGERRLARNIHNDPPIGRSDMYGAASQPVWQSDPLRTGVSFFSLPLSCLSPCLLFVPAAPNPHLARIGWRLAHFRSRIQRAAVDLPRNRTVCGAVLSERPKGMESA